METVILARHGESQFSVRGAMNGDPAVACPLTGDGEDQARALGEALRDTRIDLCVTTEFERTKQTADIALAGRDVPRAVVPELNDIHVGTFEGGPIDAYRAWARERTPVEIPPGGGESRAQAAARYARGYRRVVELEEPTILVVAHGLPIRYLLLCADGSHPRPIVDAVDYATPYRLARDELVEAVGRLEEWASAGVWEA